MRLSPFGHCSSDNLKFEFRQIQKSCYPDLTEGQSHALFERWFHYRVRQRDKENVLDVRPARLFAKRDACSPNVSSFHRSAARPPGAAAEDCKRDR
jgi:hypothetical protein